LRLEAVASRSSRRQTAYKPFAGSRRLSGLATAAPRPALVPLTRTPLAPAPETVILSQPAAAWSRATPRFAGLAPRRGCDLAKTRGERICPVARQMRRPGYGVSAYRKDRAAGRSVAKNSTASECRWGRDRWAAARPRPGAVRNQSRPGRAAATPAIVV